MAKQKNRGVYVCKYCGHRQDRLYGNYLCPVCRHVLIPPEKVSFWKKNRALPWLLAVLVLLILFIWGQRSGFLPPLPKLANSVSEWAQTLPAPKPLEESRAEQYGNFVFEDVKSDIVVSEFDGKQYFMVDGTVRPPAVLAYDAELTLELSQSNAVIYSESKNLGVLSSLKPYAFSFKVDLSLIPDYDQHEQLSSRVWVHALRPLP